MIKKVLVDFSVKFNSLLLILLDIIFLKNYEITKFLKTFFLFFIVVHFQVNLLEKKILSHNFLTTLTVIRKKLFFVFLCYN